MLKLTAHALVIGSLLFGALYPLNFFVFKLLNMKVNNLKFHIRNANFCSGIAIVLLLVLPAGRPGIYYAILWKVFLILVSAYSWKKTMPNSFLFVLTGFSGLLVCFYLQDRLIGLSTITASVLFAIAFLYVHILFKILNKNLITNATLTQ